MADFFGGILDNVKSLGNDFESFFGSGLGDAAVKGIAGGAQDNSKVRLAKLNEAQALASHNTVPDMNRYSPASDNKFGEVKSAASYEDIERQWFTRLHRFSQIDSEIQAGKVNLGKPQ